MIVSTSSSSTEGFSPEELVSTRYQDGVARVAQNKLTKKLSVNLDRELSFKAALTYCMGGKWNKVSRIGLDILNLRSERDQSLFSVCVEQGLTESVAGFLAPAYREELSKDELSRAFQAAAQRGWLDIIALLYEHTPINQPDRLGKTPLHTGVEAGQDRVVQALVKNGASLNRQYKEQGLLFSPLTYAIRRGELECLQTLMSQARRPFNHRVKGVGNLLHLVIQFGQTPILDWLIQKYAAEIERLIEEPNGQGQTPLSLAAYHGDLQAIQWLCDLGAQINIPDESTGRTPAHWAALGKAAESIKRLYQLGAKFSLRDNDDKTPAQLAQTSNLQALFQNLHDRPRNLPFKHSLQPPHNLVFKGHGEVGYLGALEVLTNKGALSELKRIAGTSTGGILATLVALGYPLEGMQDHLRKGLSKLLSPSRAKLTKPVSKRLYKMLGQVRAQNASFLLGQLSDSAPLCDQNPFLEWIEADS